MTVLAGEKTNDRRAGDRREGPVSCDPQVLDLQGLLDRCMGNLDLVQRLLDRFEQWVPDELAELEEALAIEDAERIAQAAHRIKGSSANISALGLQRAASEIVDRSRSGRLTDLRACVDHLRCQWMQYVAASALAPAAIEMS
jgi:HPt (histidine-containing phosphotransfer) domain-containing protein